MIGNERANNEGVTALPIPGLLPQAAVSPAPASPEAGTAGGQACGDDGSGPSLWGSVWKEAGPAEVLAGHCTEDGAGAQRSEADEESDALKTTLALVFLAVPISAGKPPIPPQWNEAAVRKSEPAALQGTQPEVGQPLQVVFPPITAEKPRLDPVGEQQSERDPLLAGPGQAFEGAEPAESEQAAGLDGARFSGSTAMIGPRPSWPAKPVADVLLRRVSRQTAATAGDVTPLLKGRNAPPPSYEPIPAALRAPQTTGEQSLARVVAFNQPGDAGLRTGAPGGKAMAADHGPRAGGQPALEETQPPSGAWEEGETQAPRPPEGETEPAAAPPSGDPETGQRPPGKQDPQWQGIQQREPVEEARPAGPPPQAAPSRGAQHAMVDSKPRGETIPMGRAEMEPPQNPARLNGQLEVQVDGQGGQRVRLRFAEAPGGVRMRVTSNDARLAESLRAEWQTLETALRRTGWDPQPAAIEPAEPVPEALGWIHERTGGRGGSDAGGGQRAAPPAAGHGQAQAEPGGGYRRDGRPDGRDEIRQEWLDLSALRRLGRRRKA